MSGHAAYIGARPPALASARTSPLLAPERVALLRTPLASMVAEIGASFGSAIAMCLTFARAL